MHSSSADTICAIATPHAVGAISVIRVSGPLAKKSLVTLFAKNITTVSSHTIHYGNIRFGDELIDEVLVSVFDEGKSYTGEESIEISCHGSPFIQQQILRALIHAGCRLAEPGEFTQRAFLHGKLDLSQAEAVSDLIASQTKAMHQMALGQLKGRFSHELKQLREQLIHFASLIELELDFAEEDVEFADRTALFALMDEVLTKIRRLITSFELGNALKQGVPVAIVGAPNTGKSTLLNQLLGEDRAIVSDIAGTTRDVIEEVLIVEGISFRLIDTAGIRETKEEIESMGIERSLQKIEQAQIVLCLADGSLTGEVLKAAQWTATLKMQFPDKSILFVVNKLDVAGSLPACDFAISAKTGEGIEQLKEAFVEAVRQDFDFANETIISNTRHLEALQRTDEYLTAAYSGLEQQVPADLVAMDIRAAMRALGNITGEIEIDTDILGNIFSKFCIGK